MEASPTCEYKQKYLEAATHLYWFRKMAEEGTSPESTTPGNILPDR